MVTACHGKRFVLAVAIEGGSLDGFRCIRAPVESNRFIVCLTTSWPPGEDYSVSWSIRLGMQSSRGFADLYARPASARRESRAAILISAYRIARGTCQNGLRRSPISLSASQARSTESCDLMATHIQLVQLCAHSSNPSFTLGNSICPTVSMIPTA
jgi:hypothetical protein